MCAIMGSFSKDKLLELIELNSYRGSHSFSFSTYDIQTSALHVHLREYGKINFDDIQLFNDEYGIVHIQAPTTEATSSSNIHPSKDEKYRTYLWHNGIIKADYVKKLQEKFGVDTAWDTELLHQAVNEDMNNLNEIDGSFSCLWYGLDNLHLLRNDISPMFIDDQFSISSTKFKGSRATQANKVIMMDLLEGKLYNVHSFKTVNNPYFFGE